MKPTPDPVEILLKTTAEDRKQAQWAYTDAIETAVEEGWTNVRIARAVGVSETAIRKWRMRHNMS